MTGNYDPETNLAYWGTGNGGPWMGDQRPGDNLYTSSTLAIDVATGAIKGHHQYHPNDSWDWDEVSPPILADYTRNGRTVKGLIDVARDGYLWFLERSNGPIGFVEGTPFVKQNVFKSLDPKTGRPDVDPDHKPGTGKQATFCPSLWGGKNWPPVAFSPKTRLLYIPGERKPLRDDDRRARDVCRRASDTSARPTRFRSRKAPTTSARCRRGTSTRASACGPTPTRRRRTGARCSRPAAGWCSRGGTNDREFHAFDAKNGKLLWKFPTNSGIIGQPTSFLAGGRQYVAVQSGWGVDSQGMETQLNNLRPGRASRKCPRAGPSGCLRSNKTDVERRDTQRSRRRSRWLLSAGLAALGRAARRFGSAGSSASRAIITSVDLMIATASSPRRSFSSWMASPVMTAVSR